MRFTGAILLWTAFTMVGIKTSLLLKNRVALIEDTVAFLNMLSVGIEFSKTDIYKILKTLASEAAIKNLSFLNTFILFEEHEDFHSSWRKAIKRACGYRKDEKEKLLQLGAFLGTTDAINQVKTIKIYEAFFEKYRKCSINEYEKYGKVTPLLGLFSGACVFTLLI